MKAYFLFILVSFFCITSVGGQEIFKKSTSLMGSDFEITVVAENQKQGDTYIDLAITEMSRIEKLISSWDPNSETSLVNQNAGISPVKISKELFQLILRSTQISQLTDGAFDITYASMDHIWKFDGSMTTMPSLQKIKASVEKVGFENIILDKKNSTAFLKNKGMKIGFGAIGKGYAADRAKKMLQERGVTAGIINASGDMNTWGVQPSSTPWQVAITNPMDKDKAFALLPIKGAVVTSGNYEKFVTFNNTRYSHIIDPRTGYPASGIVSATVFAPQAELADALATSIFVMGTEIGLDRISQLPGIECIIINADGTIASSEGITLKTK